MENFHAQISSEAINIAQIMTILLLLKEFLKEEKPKNAATYNVQAVRVHS